MAQPFVGQVLAVGFQFAPVGWLPCDGRSLPIAQYDVLYSLIGTTYGGDGVNTFNVPDLRGRLAIHQGQKPGLPNVVIGQAMGTESVTLAQTELPAHGHTLSVSSTTGTTNIPASSVLLAAGNQESAKVYDAMPASPTALAPGALTGIGAGQPHENRQPVLTINYIICAEGVYPPQS